MSVSLREVLEHSGYDIENSYEDAIWFLAKQNEFAELVEIADQTVEFGQDGE